MSVKGKVSEFKDFTKKVGLFEGKVLAFNPSREQLEKILGTELQKDPEYLKEDGDGNKMTNLTIWVEDVKTGFKSNVRITLIDKIRSNKEGNKYQWLNIQGNTTWADTEDNLPAWFSAFDHRKAYVGEDQLYNFAKNWLQIDTYNDKTAEISFDFQKLLKGNVKELSSLIGNSDYDHTVLFNSIIATSTGEDDEGNEVTKEYQNLYNKEFLPGSTIKFFNLGGKLPKFVQKYVDNCNGEYGIKDYFILEPLQDYNPENNPVSEDDALVEDSPNY